MNFFLTLFGNSFFHKRRLVMNEKKDKRPIWKLDNILIYSMISPKDFSIVRFISINRKEVEIKEFLINIRQIISVYRTQGITEHKKSKKKNSDYVTEKIIAFPWHIPFWNHILSKTYVPCWKATLHDN